jgi:hypothetical protein
MVGAALAAAFFHDGTRTVDNMWVAMACQATAGVAPTMTARAHQHAYRYFTSIRAYTRLLETSRAILLDILPYIQMSKMLSDDSILIH